MSGEFDVAPPAAGDALPLRVYRLPAVSLLSGVPCAAGRVTRQDVSVLMCLDAAGSFEIDGAGWSHRMQAVAIAPNTPHRLSAATGTVLRLSVELVDPRFPTLRRRLEGPLTPLDRGAFLRFDTRLADAHAGHLSLHACALLVDEILELLLQDTPPAPALDARVRHALRTLGTDVDHAFDQMAAELSVSASRLSHLFAQQLGTSMRACQAWARLARAWEMVVWQHELSLTEIAQRLSYSEPSHLARAFRRGHGIAPTMFRDAHKVQVLGVTQRVADACATPYKQR